jgi:class 3 adenylate cyclase
MASTRRLAAILAADVAGYSRLMGADEEGTLERLKAHRRQLIDPKITEHHGRIVKTTGDGLLAEFVSVVDALRCATEVQAGMTQRNAAAPADQGIEFRIGIHQGDVVVEDHDIFGDAVNVAARLEALAEPGGICVSARVRGDSAGKLDLSFEDIGQQQLKNIARPVRAYALRPERLADLSRPRLPLRTPGYRRIIAGTAAAVAALVIAIGAWWYWPATKHSPTLAVTATTSAARPLGARRMSIVVLPFVNLNYDPDQQYFADGFTEDLTTDLSRIADMLVISRNTAFTYRNKPVDTKQIGRHLWAERVRGRHRQSVCCVERHHRSDRAYD